MRCFCGIINLPFYRSPSAVSPLSTFIDFFLKRLGIAVLYNYTRVAMCYIGRILLSGYAMKLPKANQAQNSCLAKLQMQASQEKKERCRVTSQPLINASSMILTFWDETE